MNLTLHENVSMKAAMIRLAMGFALVEIVVVLAVMSVLGGLGYVSVTAMVETSEAQKLQTDVATVNRAVQLYLANGGAFDGTETADGVLAKLKTRANSDSAEKIVGLKSSFIDPRTDTGWDEESGGRLRAQWDDASKSFIISATSGRGIKEFTINEGLSASAAGTEDRTPTKEASATGWVWNYDPASATVSSGGTPTSGSGTTPSLPGTGSGSAPRAAGRSRAPGSRGARSGAAWPGP